MNCFGGSRQREPPAGAITKPRRCRQTTHDRLPNTLAPAGDKDIACREFRLRRMSVDAVMENDSYLE